MSRNLRKKRHHMAPRKARASDNARPYGHLSKLEPQKVLNSQILQAIDAVISEKKSFWKIVTTFVRVVVLVELILTALVGV